MVFIDELRVWGNWRYGRSCHLLPETHTSAAMTELHEFASRLGMKQAWFQNVRWPHYDLTAGKRVEALKLGAVKIETKFYIKSLKLGRRPRADFDTTTLSPPDFYDELFQGRTVRKFLG